MSEFSREQLSAYLDDALADADTARIEAALRDSEPLRRQLRAVIAERDRGEHSLGAVWRRERLTCPTRAQLGTYLLQALEPEFQSYVEFHLTIVGCPFCRANHADLEALAAEEPAQMQRRRRKYYDSSAGYLSVARDAKK